MKRLLLAAGLSLLTQNGGFAQNNPFSPLRIFVPDSDVIAFDFKSIGKINGDSFGDYTYRLVSQSSLCGKQQVFRGGSVLDTIPIYELTPGDNFTSFVKAGDLNGDGFSDFLSTPSPSTCPYLPNQITAYWGTATGIDTIPNRLLPFPIPSSPSGSDRAEIVSNLDVNGDSFKDVLLLYLHRDSGNAVYLFNGIPGGVDSLSSWKVSTPPRSPSALRELTGMDAGDLNNDGYADIFVGKRAAFEFQDSIFGLVEIYLGGPNFTLDTIPDFVINPPTLNSSRLDSIYFGSTIKFLGDLNDNSLSEFAIDGPSKIYSCPPVVDWEPAYRLGGNTIDAGDVNGDGFLDLMIGHTSFPPPLGFGAVIFLLGGPNFDNTGDAIITDQDLPPDFLENIGRAVGFIGDINGDGAEEFMFLADRIIPANRHEVFMFAGNTTVKTGVGGGGKPQVPRSFELFQNSPNPFSSSTEIGFRLKPTIRPETIRLEIYNLLGQRVRTLVNERRKVGEHKVLWDGRDGNGKSMPSGVYLYKLSFGDEVQVKRMLFVR